MRIYNAPSARDLYLSEQLSERVLENAILLDTSQNVSKSTNPLFIRVIWNAKFPPKRRSWHRLLVVQYFLLNSAVLLERLAEPVT